MNGFVEYLNSTNNVGGNSSGSLAEIQVKSAYYDSIKVDRNLGKYIADCVIKKQHKAFVLTGHAGDGKTSILVQVLKSLGRLKACEGICDIKEYEDLYYCKDMSEISSDQQVDVLYEALCAPERNRTSLLISNTGPLLKTFELLIKRDREKAGLGFTNEERLQLQSTLLTQLDRNIDESIHIENYDFILVNIARVDNVPFATKIMKNILNDKLWTECQTCSCAERCPIKNNRDIVSANFDRVACFIDNFYRYLYENDKRMTIRQMIGQISYAITGNLTCSYIFKKHLKEPFFNYNFANLFFGYKGLKKEKNASRIKGIEQIQKLELDRIALDIDYNIFVKHDYSCFSPSIQEELKAIMSRYRKHYQVSDEDDLINEKKQEEELLLRRAVRRYYLLYSLAESTEDMDAIWNQIYGEVYTDYRNLLLSKQTKSQLKKIQNIFFAALYVRNTGYLPDHNQNSLPLTLRREDDVFQNVMIMLGEVHKNSLEIGQIRTNSLFEDVPEKYNLFLRFGKADFVLSLPMVTYFSELINGAISSVNNPALTHGIAQLDTLLLEEFGDADGMDEESCELNVVINTTHGPQIENFVFENNQLHV